MQPFTKPQLKSLAELMPRGGATASSDWTTGFRSQTSRRALPPFCKRVSAVTAQGMPGEVGKAARRLVTARPGVRFLVVVDNLRAARAALRAQGVA